MASSGWTGASGGSNNAAFIINNLPAPATTRDWRLLVPARPGRYIGHRNHDYAANGTVGVRRPDQRRRGRRRQANSSNQLQLNLNRSSRCRRGSGVPIQQRLRHARGAGRRPDRERHRAAACSPPERRRPADSG
jgi:hypothetical protein